MIRQRSTCALGLLLALGLSLSLGCSSSPTKLTEASPDAAENGRKVRHVAKPSILIFPAGGEAASESSMSSELVNTVDLSTTVQVVDRDGQTYYRRGYLLHTLQFYGPTRGRSVGRLCFLEVNGVIKDTSTVWTMEDSVAYVYEPIDLNGATPDEAAYAAASDPPPPPPEVEVPPISVDHPPRTRQMSWGQVKARWR